MISEYKGTKTSWGVSTKIIETENNRTFFLNVEPFEMFGPMVEEKEVGLAVLSGEVIVETYKEDGSIRSRTILKDNNTYAVIPAEIMFSVSTGEDEGIVIGVFAR